MSLRVGVAAFGLLLSSSVFSAVTITAPEEIVILAVNGQEVNTGLIPAKKHSYQVDAGNLTLNVRYREYFEHLTGEHDKVLFFMSKATKCTENDAAVYCLICCISLKKAKRTYRLFGVVS